MTIGKRAAIAVAALLLPLGAARAEKKDAHKLIRDQLSLDTELGAPGGSPFQKGLKEKMKQRKGKPMPFIDYGIPKLEEIPDGVGYAPGDCPDAPTDEHAKKRCPVKGYVVKYSATTTVKFSGPKDVHDPTFDEEKDPDHKNPKWKWPALKVRNQVQTPDGDHVPDGDPNDPASYVDYTEQARRDAQAQVGFDENGNRVQLWPDPEHPEVPYQWENDEEPREQEVTEELTFTFPEGQQQAKDFFRRLAQAAQAQGEPVSLAQAIVMGFTYSGPNIDYTIGDKKKVCFFGCFTLWDFKAGFALDWALGLRLPAMATLQGPVEPLVAGRPYSFTSSITPSDWTADLYKQITGIDAAAENGNEFVMRFKFFAGAYVKVLGIDVCPYCQYVDVDTNYSKSFTTPFGETSPGHPVSFPFGDIVPRIEVKRWDYGIVSFGVGLTITPEAGSDKITAMAWPGADPTGGAEIRHTAPDVPVAFPVTACMKNGSHQQTIRVDDYKYYFNLFTLNLGAYLDLDVAGYGAWNPEFSILSLDLRSMLGSLELNVGDHVQCNWAFQCTNAPIHQQTAATVALTDVDPPTTTLAVAGPNGDNGWYVTDVPATLSAIDNPVGCGSGVQTTYHGLSNPPPTAGTSFTLDYEGIRTLYWRSVDFDGKWEDPSSLVVRIDKTPPTISGEAIATVNDGAEPNVRTWYNHPVLVRWTASDATSGLAAVSPNPIIGEGAAQVVPGTAKDNAGLSASASVGPLNVDLTAPVIAIRVPSPDGYKNTGTITFDWSVTDALSGMLAQSATLDGLSATVVPPAVTIASGNTLELVNLGGGLHELVVNGTDNADNPNTAKVSFVIDVDIDGLVFAVEHACTESWMSQGACKSLYAKARQAKIALDGGKTNAARGVLLAFQTELNALHGKGVKENAYLILAPDVAYVLRRYGLIGNT